MSCPEISYYLSLFSKILPDALINIKGGAKKTSFFKIWYTIFSWTVGLKRLSFSGLGVLMRTPSPEKDSLLRPTVHEKIVDQILKKEGFFAPPFIQNWNGFPEQESFDIRNAKFIRNSKFYIRNWKLNPGQESFEIWNSNLFLIQNWNDQNKLQLFISGK